MLPSDGVRKGEAQSGRPACGSWPHRQPAHPDGLKYLSPKRCLVLALQRHGLGLNDATPQMAPALATHSYNPIVRSFHINIDAIFVYTQL
jgi:hypothetical protein